MTLTQQRQQPHGIRAMIVDLARLERVLAQTIARCSNDTVPDCPVLDMLDVERAPPR